MERDQAVRRRGLRDLAPPGAGEDGRPAAVDVDHASSSKSTLTTASSPSGAQASERWPVARTRTPRPRERASATARRASSTLRTVAASGGCRCTSVLYVAVASA